jgi:hypothetical protein
LALGSLQLPLRVTAATRLPFAPRPQVFCERKLSTLAFTTQPLMQYGPASDVAPARRPKRGQPTRSQMAVGVFHSRPPEEAPL